MSCRAKEWEPGDQKTPKTFIEIDSKAIARITGWEDEFVVTIDSMKHDGRVLLIRTADGETLEIDSAEFASPLDE